MKVKKIDIKHTMLLKLKLINTKMYLKKESCQSLKIEDVECRLKKGLQVIFKFHACKKKILFVGNLSSVEEIAAKKMLKNTRHAFVPEYLLSNGQYAHNNISSPYISKRIGVHEVSRPIKNNHLIIVFNSSTSNLKIESYKAKMPAIGLSNHLDVLDVTLSYKILGNFMTKCSKQIKSHLFWILIRSFLRKFRRVVAQHKKRKRLRKRLKDLQKNKFKK